MTTPDLFINTLDTAKETIDITKDITNDINSKNKQQVINTINNIENVINTAENIEIELKKTGLLNKCFPCLFK